MLVTSDDAGGSIPQHWVHVPNVATPMSFVPWAQFSVVKKVGYFSLKERGRGFESRHTPLGCVAQLVER